MSNRHILLLLHSWMAGRFKFVFSSTCWEPFLSLQDRPVCSVKLVKKSFYLTGMITVFGLLQYIKMIQLNSSWPLRIQSLTMLFHLFSFRFCEWLSVQNLHGDKTIIQFQNVQNPQKIVIIWVPLVKVNVAMRKLCALKIINWAVAFSYYWLSHNNYPITDVNLI